MYEMSRQSRFDARYWMLGAGALGRPGEGGGREEGGGFRMGNTCIPVADSFWYLAKLIQFVKFKNKIKLIIIIIINKILFSVPLSPFLLILMK